MSSLSNTRTPLRRMPRASRQRFSELGFPTTHDEDWRFTSVAPISRTQFERCGGGALPAEGSQPAPRVGITHLSESPVEQYLARYAGYQNSAFVALNTANFEDGLFIHIAKGAVIEEPIELVIQSSANGH